MRWATVSPRVRKLLIRLNDTFWRVAAGIRRQAADRLYGGEPMKTRLLGSIVLPTGIYRLTEPILVRGKVRSVIEGAAAVATEDKIGDLSSIEPNNERATALAATDVGREGIRAADGNRALTAKIENTA
jgi:hypothetical protein